jgi:hypothetical protein
MQNNDLITALAPVIQKSDLSEDQKKLITNKLTEVATPLQTDPWIYRLVVIFLGLTVITTMVGGVYLNLSSDIIPSGIVAIGSAAVGALAGLLAPPPSTGNNNSNT